ncbi:helix-turn-helix domain-containing protein [Faecalispora jeddahensis]|uniref:helix-turn-helix domain-containing protein n=1 Tax=Faecalispora jeddahensis TaxID=1414721 RepID=UPI001898AE14|nr:helix-turn-helix transcriptional regulator [Faecalispora jeddahensis]
MLNIPKIEALIKEKGWSNSYFCSLFGKNPGWIKDWKRGKGLPDENTLQIISDKLNTTVDYLTDKTEQKNKPLTEVRGLSPEAINLAEQIEQLSPANRAKLNELIGLYLSAQDKKK